MPNQIWKRFSVTAKTGTSVTLTPLSGTEAVALMPGDVAITAITLATCGPTFWIQGGQYDVGIDYHT
jgi:hypothetical protein